MTSSILIACGSSPSDPDAGDTPSDAGDPPRDAGDVDAGEPPPSDAGPPEGDAGPPASTLTITRWGERLYGRPVALSRVERELWIGMSVVNDLSLPSAPIRGGLARLHLDTGEVTVFEAELPMVAYDTDVFGPTSTAGVLADGNRRIVVARSGILTVEADDTVTARSIPLPGGAPASPTHLALDAARRRLWAGTNRGLVQLDADTFAVERAYDATELGAWSIGAVAVDPTDGSVYAAVYPDGGESTVVRVLGDAVTTLDPDGLVGDVVFDPARAVAVIAIASWDPSGGGVITWDGARQGLVVTEHELSMAARGESGPFGARALALEGDVLVVGGAMRSVGPVGFLEGGGLAWVDLADLDTPRLAGVSVGTSAIRGDVIAAAAYDPETRRTFAATGQACSETKLGNTGVTAIRWVDDAPVFELPILSGVRDLARVDGALFAAIRDDIGGLACEGVNVSHGVVGVDARRGGVALARSSRDFEGWAPTRMGATELAFRGGTELFAGFREDLFIGRDGGGLANPAITFGTSLWPEEIAFESDDVFWIVGRTSHDASDDPILDDAGPRGAARVTLNERGDVIESTQYVHAARDPSPDVVEGLPSSEVYDVLVDEDARETWLVCGTERVRATYDRQPRAVFPIDGAPRRGGIARIDADGVHVVADGTVVPDGRAAAFGADGALYVADAERGLLRRTDAGDFEELDLDDGVPTGATPLALYVDEGALVVGYDRGALLEIGGERRFVDDVGAVWTVSPHGAALLLGTDRGLVRVVPEGAVDLGEPAASDGGAIPFVGGDPGNPDPDGGVPDVDGGACLPVGTPCGAMPDACCAGAVCASAGIVLTCEAL